MNTYVSTGPPVWAYIAGIPLLIMFACAWWGSMQPGHKIRRYKTVNGRRVRDYDAERELRQRTDSDPS